MFGSPWMNGENWMNSRSVFVTGGTVYLGQRLIQELLTRGHRVRALTRPGSGGRLPPNCVTVLGDALDPASYQNQIHTLDTFCAIGGSWAPPIRSKPHSFAAWTFWLVAGPSTLRNMQACSILFMSAWRSPHLS